MFDVDTRDFKTLERDLWLLSTRAGPYANANALTAMAREGQTLAREMIKKDFVNRNTWTARSVQFDRARVGKIGKEYSVLGSVAQYMGSQEFGGNRLTRGKHGVPIPTKIASGEGESAGVRKRLPTKRNTLKAITLTNKQIRAGHTNGQRQRNAIAVTTALRKGGGDVFLHLARRVGIFRVSGTRKNAKIVMLYDLSHPQVLIHKHPWLHPAAEAATRKGPELYVKALERKIELFKMFKSGKFKR